MVAFAKKFGWAGEEEAEKAWQLIGEYFPHFFIAGQRQATQGRTFRAWDIVRKVLGQDLFTSAQDSGDCVAVSARDAVEVISLIEIAKGEPQKFRRIFAPFHYATARLSYSKDWYKRYPRGAIGSLQARAIGEFGCLFADEPGVPEYSGDLADLWGNNKGNWATWMPKAAPYKCQSARITTWSQLVDAVINGYISTMASSLGFSMMAGNDGFHRRYGTWDHQMGIWGICDDRQKPWLGIHNNWGDQHGQVRDFETDALWPKGMLRVRPEDIEPALRSGEIMAYSRFDGFPDQSNKWDEWQLISDEVNEWNLIQSS